MGLVLKIEKLVTGGAGLAYSDAGVVMVAGVLPGETVEVEEGQARGGVRTGLPSRIIEPSPKRREPPCPFVGRCGGCDWQHISYDEQVVLKQRIWEDCLQRIGQLTSVPEIEVVVSPEWEYRCRAQLKVDILAGTIGFYARGTADVVRVDSCPLLVSQINKLLQDQEEILPGLGLSVMEIKVVAGAGATPASAPVIEGHTREAVSVSVGERRFVLTSAGFSQGNAFLLESLGTWAADEIGGEFLVDMYGGQGFFSIMLADRFSRGLLIESIDEQVDKAKQNFEYNEIEHFGAEATTAEDYFSAAQSALEKPDCIILDPPRPGFTRKVREGLRDMGANTLLYVSCNPATQARDINFLVREGGYGIVRCALFDLYPQTSHLETAVLLKQP